MLTDRQVEAYIEKNILAQQNIRRLANGSIDYTFYDTHARVHRSAAFRTACRSISALFRRAIGVLISAHLERQEATHYYGRTPRAAASASGE